MDAKTFTSKNLTNTQVDEFLSVAEQVCEIQSYQVEVVPVKCLRMDLFEVRIDRLTGKYVDLLADEQDEILNNA
jgi:hypothetical protein